MKSESMAMSMAMLKAVLVGQTYDAVADEYRVSRTAVERRIKRCAQMLSREVGIDGVNEDGVAFVQRLRNSGEAVMNAIDRYTPAAPPQHRTARILSDEDIATLVQRTRMRSASPQRDLALLYVLLSTGARPLEIARLEVRDYLNPDGSVRKESTMRTEVAVNHKARRLFFASAPTREALDDYLADRLRRFNKGKIQVDYRGFLPHSQLFLTESGAPFDIVRYGKSGQTRFLCRGILEAYRKIFRRSGLGGMSALNVRRTVAARLLARGAQEDQIGELLGISELKSVRELLPKVRRPLEEIVHELV